MADVDDLSWFRRPDRAAGHPGTLNACYAALDAPVIHGRADDVALVDDGREHSVAWLLTEVAAFAGVLRAFGVGLGAQVQVAGLPPLHHVVATLACARLGAVVTEAPDPPAQLAVLGTAPADERPDAPADGGPDTVITADTSSELDWDTLMRAGRTDPAGCADVPGDQPLRTGGPGTADHLAAVLAGAVTDPVLGPLLHGVPIDLTDLATGTGEAP